MAATSPKIQKPTVNKFTQLLPFVQDLFDDPAVARKAAKIVTGVLEGRSPRMSDIARAMGGTEVANYKYVQRFLEANDPQEVLLRLFREDAPFVIGDPTEMPRPQAKKTEYVGTLSDGETKGYWLLLLATPYHGGRSHVVLWITRRRRSIKMRPPVISITLLRFGRSKSCWETGPWC